MAIKTRAQLKAYFRKGLYPTENQFGDMIDSYVHKGEKVELSQVNGLSEALNSKFNSTDGKIIETKQKQQENVIAHLQTVQETQSEEIAELEDLGNSLAHSVDEMEQAVNILQCEAVRYSDVGASDGVAPLDEFGHVPDRHLPNDILRADDIDVSDGVCPLNEFGKVPDSNLPNDLLRYSDVGASDGVAPLDEFGHVPDKNLPNDVLRCSDVGASDGVAPLNEFRKVPSEYLPDSLKLGYTNDKAFPGGDGLELKTDVNLLQKDVKDLDKSLKDIDAEVKGIDSEVKGFDGKIDKCLKKTQLGAAKGVAQLDSHQMIPLEDLYTDQPGALPLLQDNGKLPMSYMPITNDHTGTGVYLITSQYIDQIEQDVEELKQNAVDKKDVALRDASGRLNKKDLPADIVYSYEVGASDGVAPLNEFGKLPLEYLPIEEEEFDYGVKLLTNDLIGRQDGIAPLDYWRKIPYDYIPDYLAKVNDVKKLISKERPWKLCRGAMPYHAKPGCAYKLGNNGVLMKISPHLFRKDPDTGMVIEGSFNIDKVVRFIDRYEIFRNETFKIVGLDNTSSFEDNTITYHADHNSGFQIRLLGKFDLYVGMDEKGEIRLINDVIIQKPVHYPYDIINFSLHYEILQNGEKLFRGYNINSRKIPFERFVRSEGHLEKNPLLYKSRHRPKFQVQWYHKYRTYRKFDFRLKKWVKNIGNNGIVKTKYGRWNNIVRNRHGLPYGLVRVRVKPSVYGPASPWHYYIVDCSIGKCVELFSTKKETIIN